MAACSDSRHFVPVCGSAAKDPSHDMAWLHHLDDDSWDDLDSDYLETWWETDLCRSTGDDEPADGYRQFAVVGVVMGDSSAVRYWKWLTDASSSTLECSELSQCRCLNAHCRKDQSSEMFTSMI